jgi:bifunctional non-homologous end joining protein LigD
VDADFMQPMECLPVSKLPDGPNWLWEIKLDGYRVIAVKNSGNLSLWSRNRKSLNRQFLQIVEALKELPDGTVVDGEVVAMGDDRPNFNLLQNFKSEAKRVRFFAFDLLCFENRDLTGLSLVQRRELLRSVVFADSRIIALDYLEAAPQDTLAAVRAQGFEGIIGKRKDSVYEQANVPALGLNSASTLDRCLSSAATSRGWPRRRFDHCRVLRRAKADLRR